MWLTRPNPGSAGYCTTCPRFILMPIFSSLAGFFRRHRRKLLVATAATVLAYVLFDHFVLRRFRNFQNALRQELYVKEQIKRRFIQTQTDCYLTLLALLPVLTQPVLQHLPTETITAALKRKKNSLRETLDLLTRENLMAHAEEPEPELQVLLAKSKLDLWHELKVKSIARIMSLIYSLAGLLLLTRLQLNILARKQYLELAIAMAGGSVQAQTQLLYDYFVEQAYLSLSWWLLNHGWQRMAGALETAVAAKFADISPKTELLVDTFSAMLHEICSEVSGSQVTHAIFPLEHECLVETLLNTNPELVHELDNGDSNLAKLINETNFIMANDFSTHVFSALVRSGVDTLALNLDYALNPDAVRLHKLATFLAQLSVQSNVICDAQGEELGDATGNIYINTFNDLEELDEFSASIYSNFE